MKKSNATLVWMALIIFAAITWVAVVKGQVESRVSYKNYMKQAASFEEKGIYINALENYESALALDPNNFDIVMKMAEMYRQLGDYNGFLNMCDEAIAIQPKNATPYVRKAEYYIEHAQYNEAIKVVKSASKIKDSKEIKELNTTLSTKCIEKYVSFNAIGDWHIQDAVNYVAVQENEKWGMTLKDGTRKIRLKHEYVGAYDEESGVIPCCLDGVYYYMDLEGNKRLIGDKDYQYLGSFGNGWAPAQRDGKYGYINTLFEEKNFEYDYAGAFSNNVAAVQKDGKWALISEKFKNITEFKYDEILVDSYGYCANFDLIVVREGNEYSFINHKGEKVGKETFEGAKMPASNDSYIAIKKNGKWGYADQKGKVIIKPQYQDAKSFAMGMAPIAVENRWGYINTDGKVVIEPKYFDAGVFSEDGSAPVKNSTSWNFLVLCEYDD